MSQLAEALSHPTDRVIDTEIGGVRKVKGRTGDGGRIARFVDVLARPSGNADPEHSLGGALLRIAGVLVPVGFP